MQLTNQIQIPGYVNVFRGTYEDHIDKYWYFCDENWVGPFETLAQADLHYEIHSPSN